MDEVMLAMDIVDTLRRDNRVVQREISAETQEENLLNRLKDIYGKQGIDVPDEILKEGIQALREDRFTYKPTPPSASRFFATIYVKRSIWAKPLIAVSVIIVLIILMMTSWPMTNTKESTPAPSKQIDAPKMENEN